MNEAQRLTQLSELAQECEQQAGRLLNLARALLTTSALLTGKEPPEELVERPAPAKRIEEEEIYAVSSRHGKITLTMARSKAIELAEFTTPQLAEALSLTPTTVMRFITALAKENAVMRVNGRHRCLLLPSMINWVRQVGRPFSAIEAAEATGMSDEEVTDELEKLCARQILRPIGEGQWEYIPPSEFPNPREHETKLPPEKERPSYDLAPVRGLPVRVAAVKRATRRQRSVEGARGIKGPKAKDRRYEQAQKVKEERKTKAQKSPGFKSRSKKRRAA